MTYTLDTSGCVDTHPGDNDRGYSVWWHMLTPFTQGYVEALYVSLREGDLGYLPVKAIKDVLRFDALAPDTLARIIADCEGERVHQSDDNERATGRNFWARRQAGNSPFPPLTVCLGAGDKVLFS